MKYNNINMFTIFLIYYVSKLQIFYAAAFIWSSCKIFDDQPLVLSFLDLQNEVSQEGFSDLAFFDCPSIQGTPFQGKLLSNILKSHQNLTKVNDATQFRLSITV